jgi:cytochrome P450
MSSVQDTAPQASPESSASLEAAVGRFFNDPNVRANPHALFDALHKQAPLINVGGTWFVTGYDEATSLLRDERVSRWEAARTELAIEALESPELRDALGATIKMMINRDEPDHTRLRRLIRHVFLPNEVAGWAVKIERISDAIMAKVKDKKEFDFLAEVAFPLPEMIICDLLGVPLEDHDLWSKWSHEILTANRTPAPTGENLRIVQNAYISFYNYFRELIEERKKAPGDDLMSLLIKAEEDGDKLSMDELVGTAIMLIQAGQETTANLIANGMYLLLKSPRHYQQLVEDKSLIPAAVLEFLRLESPSVLNLPRVALEDIECGGQTIPKGDHILISVYATGFDPEIFERPLEMNFARENMYKSVAFSVGIHACLGRQFALLEAHTMFRKIMETLPHLELVEEPERSNTFTRGWSSLKVRNLDVA